MDNQNSYKVYALLRASDKKQTTSCDTQFEIIRAACKSLGLNEPSRSRSHLELWSLHEVCPTPMVGGVWRISARARR